MDKKMKSKSNENTVIIDLIIHEKGNIDNYCLQ